MSVLCDLFRVPELIVSIERARLWVLKKGDKVFIAHHAIIGINHLSRAKIEVYTLQWATNFLRRSSATALINAEALPPPEKIAS
jgi:hypothetical protein